MSSETEKFRRYFQEHSRILDPEVLQSSVKIVGIDLETWFRPTSDNKAGKKKLHKNRPFDQDEKPSISNESEAASSPLGNVSDDELNDPLKHSSLADFLLWLQKSEMKVMRQRTGKQSFSERLIETDEEPEICASPSTLTCHVPLFQEQNISTRITDGQSVELVWQSADEDKLQRVVMNYQRRGVFATTIGIEDGHYLFAYILNDRMRPDARYAQRLVLRHDAVLAPIKLRRQLRFLTLQNKGKTEEIVRLESHVPWLIPEVSKLKIPARETVRSLIRLLPQRMKPGMNEGRASLLAQRSETETEAATIDVKVVAEAKGAIPDFRCHPTNFGSIRQGIDNLQLDVEVRARGRGTLTGMIIVHHLEQPVKFRLEADGHSCSSHKLVVDSTKLPYRTDGSVRVTFLTDSYLANYRFYEVELPYHLVYLKKSLPALAFGSVRQGTTRTLRLEVKRSDGEDVDLKVSVPEHIAGCLVPYPGVRPNTCVFHFDTRKLRLATIINEEVTLMDSRSGLHDRIKVMATVSNHHESGAAETLARTRWR